MCISGSWRDEQHTCFGDRVHRAVNKQCAGGEGGEWRGGTFESSGGQWAMAAGAFVNHSQANSEFVKFTYPTWLIDTNNSCGRCRQR